MALTQTEVSQLYVSIFGRASEGAGNTYWQETGLDMQAAAKEMLATDAAATYFGTSLDTDQAFIEHIYLNTLGKTVADDATGIAFWVDALSNGYTREFVVSELIDAAQDPKNAGAAQDQFNNKVAVSDYCADNIDAADVSDLSAFTAYIADVTDDSATVDAAQASIDADVSTPGETFTLTNSTTVSDVLIGTAGDDTFNADAGTYQAGDTIIDQTTTDSDTFNVTSSADLDLTIGTISGVENVVATINKANAAGDEADFTVTGMKNVDFTASLGDLAGGAIAGEVDLKVIDLQGETSSFTAGTGIETLNVAQSTAGATVNADTVETDVTVTGGGVALSAAIADGTITVDANDDGAVSIDADAAGTIDVSNASEGLVLNAAAAIDVDVAGIDAGATLNIGASTATGKTIDIAVTDVDDSGVTIVAGTHDNTNNSDVVSIDGTAGLLDAADLTIAGDVALTLNATQQVENLTLTASGELDVDVTSSATKSLTLAGSDAITLTTNSAVLTGSTITNNATGDVKLVVDTADAAMDLTKADSVTSIALKADFDAKAVTVNTAQNLIVSDQSGTFTVAAADSDATDNALTVTAAADSVDNDIDAAAVVLTDFATVAVDASASSVTLTGALTATGSAVIVSGDENVTLTDVAAKSFDGSAMTGDLVVDLDLATSVKSLTSGAGDDNITLDEGLVFTIDAGAGDNTINVTNIDVATTIVTGAGDDTVELDDVDAALISLGSGADTVNVGNFDIDAILDGGSGTADTLAFTAAAALNLSDNANFSFAGFETVDVTAANNAITISNAQFAGQSFEVKGDSATADILAIAGTATADTIDASSVTIDTALLTVTGGAGADTLTASADGTTFLFAANDFAAGETVTGGAGTDIISSAVADIDLTVGTVTGIEAAVVNGGDNALTLQQGTGIESVTGYVNGTPGSMILTAGATAYEAAAEAAAVDVNLAGEWFFAAETAGTNSALTYYDESLNQAVTIELLGSLNVAADDAAALVAGSLVVTVA